MSALERRGMVEASDEELMAQVGRGDQAAFRLIAHRYAGRAVGLARRITGSESDSDDIVQEALLRVWINAPRWRPSAAFRTWFYRIVLNLCLNRKRRRPFFALDQAGEPPDPSPDAAAQLERAEFDRALAAAIAALPERQRAAIVLTYHEGFGNAEAAAALDTTVGGIETLLVRARRTLREKLQSHLED
jgi:RNA polymerase sigma-70 factor (ECF subfamily)